MQSLNFEEVLTRIVQSDPRFRREAYRFLRESLEYTQQSGSKPKREEVCHVTGRELLEGVRRYALEQFGPMAQTVLAEWGIARCEDIGEIVFNMIEFNLLAKTENDRRDDFKGGYDFHEAFRKPFLPANKLSASEAKSMKA